MDVALLAFRRLEPLFVRLPAVAQIVDGHNGGYFGHFDWPRHK